MIIAGAVAIAAFIPIFFWVRARVPTMSRLELLTTVVAIEVLLGLPIAALFGII